MRETPAPDGFWHLVRAARDLRRALQRTGLPAGDEGAGLALRSLGEALDRIERRSPLADLPGALVIA